VGGQDDGSEEPDSENDPNNLIEFDVDDEQSSDSKRLHAMTDEPSGELWK